MCDIALAESSIATMIDAVEAGQEDIQGLIPKATKTPLHQVRLAPPTPRPPKFLAIGYNYSAHLEETGMARPTRQVWCNKQQTSIVGPGDPVEVPKVAPDATDYESELGLVIGKRGKNAPNDVKAVLEVVAGFTIVNDVAASTPAVRWSTSQASATCEIQAEFDA